MSLRLASDARKNSTPRDRRNDEMSDEPKASAGVPKTKLKKAMSSIQADKAKASEYNGSAGKTQQQFMKEHGLDRTAFNLVLKLNKQEPQNQQATLRGVIEYAHKSGMFDDVDAFDDIVTRMEEIAAEVKARRHNQTEPDNVVGIATGGGGDE